jgi:MFS superfamily sulfate permease-like transporter
MMFFIALLAIFLCFVFHTVVGALIVGFCIAAHLGEWKNEKTNRNS